MNKLRTITKQLLSLLMLAFLTTGVANAQKSSYDTLSKWKSVKWENEYLWRLTGNKKYQAFDTLSKSEFKALSRKYAIRELTEYDTAYQHFLVMKQRPPYQNGWKFASTVGPTWPYCGSWNATDGTQFLKTGLGINIHADHFWGKVGLGALLGYQSFGVDKTAHQAAMVKLAQNVAYGVSIPANQVGFLPYKGAEHLYLMAGPVVSFPLGRKLTFDAGLKGGINRVDPATMGAYSLADGTSIMNVTPSSNRWHIGYNLGLALLYRITDQWSLGGAADIYNTSMNYYVQGYKKAPEEFSRLFGGYRAGLAVAYKLAQNKVVAIAPLTPPNCAAPVLEEGTNGKRYEVGTYERPVFKWRSGGAGGEEQFVFKLYKQGVNNPVYQTTTNLTTVLWPADLPFAKDPGYYYYTVHSTRVNKGGTCMSEMATGSFGVPEPIRERIVKEVCDKFTHKIYGGEVIPSYTVKRIVKDTICTCNDKDLYEYKYIRKRRAKDAKTEQYVSSYSKDFDKADLKAELPADFELPKQRSTFIYEIQQMPCGENKQVKTVARYKIYVVGKGKQQGIYKIDQLPF
jgi:hypothetical protein